MYDDPLPKNIYILMYDDLIHSDNDATPLQQSQVFKLEARPYQKTNCKEYDALDDP